MVESPKFEEDYYQLCPPLLAANHYLSANDGEYERCLDLVGGILTPVWNTTEDIEEEVTKRHMQVIRELCARFDLATTPMKELIEVANRCYRLTEHQQAVVVKRLTVEKRKLKRQKARQRVLLKQLQYNMPPKEESTASVLALDIDDQISFTKRRNRMSAQLSRDRKKQQLISLELASKSRRQECQQLRMENAELRAKLNNSSLSGCSLLVRLLVLLGVVYLLELIKGKLWGRSTPRKTPVADLATSGRLDDQGLTTLTTKIDSVATKLNCCGLADIICERLQQRTTNGILDRAKSEPLFASAWDLINT